MNDNGSNISRADISFATEIMDTLSKITDNESCGGRSAGSPAEHRAAEYLAGKFREAGLVNVTKDPCNVDQWVFEEGRLTFVNADGKVQDVVLGGYAANAEFTDEKMSMIYAGKCTEADLQDIDVKGMLLLIDIDQANDWWINFPVHEARINGAAGVICINVGGFGQEGDNVLVTQDICGPADLPVFSIGKRDGAELKSLIDASGSGSIEVTMNAKSRVTGKGVSYNIWGDIPGKTDEVIYVINHYDSYYFTVFDDVQGIGWALGIAKMLTESGYVPEKTIRFVAHGAEEWGITDSKYDWAVGAYKQITEVRPEWGNTGFATVNLDGFYAVKGEKKFCIVCTQELYDFVDKAVRDFGDTEGYTIEVNMELTSSTEDFSYTRAGIPSFVAGAYDGCLADRKVLHSSDSSWDAGFDRDAFELFHRLFAQIIVTLDKERICPINMERRISGIYEDIKGELSAEDSAVFTDTIGLLGKIYEGAGAENRNVSLKESDRYEADRALHDIYRYMHGKLIRLNWNDEMIAPHERYTANVSALERALRSMEEGSAEDAAEALCEVDFNYYAKYFSRETYRFYEEQVTKRVKPSWGAGLVDNGNEDMFDVIRALMDGVCGEAEKMAVAQAVERQKQYLKEAVAAEIDAVKEIGRMSGSLAERL